MFTLNVVETVEVPSLTVIVTVALPLRLAPGLIVTVLLAPLPPNEMLAMGISDVLLEVAVSVRLPAAVSASPTVNGMAPVGVFSVVV